MMSLGDDFERAEFEFVELDRCRTLEMEDMGCLSRALIITISNNSTHFQQAIPICGNYQHLKIARYRLAIVTL